VSSVIIEARGNHALPGCEKLEPGDDGEGNYCTGIQACEYDSIDPAARQ
jgi:hypothetical protein